MASSLSILFLSIDVVLVIKNPFYPQNWRVRMVYLPIILAVSLLYAIVMHYLISPIPDKENDLE